MLIFQKPIAFTLNRNLHTYSGYVHSRGFCGCSILPIRTCGPRNHRNACEGWSVTWCAHKLHETTERHLK